MAELNNIGGRPAPALENPAGGGAWRLVSFMAFVFLIFVFSWLGLIFGYKPFVNAQIAKKEAVLNELAGQLPKDRQDQFLKFEYQIIALQNILNKHLAVTKIFPVLEANTNQAVLYKNMDLDVTTGKVNLRAVAQSYDVMAQQLAAYQRLTNLSKYQISNTRLSDGGRVQFEATLFFKPEIFSADGTMPVGGQGSASGGKSQ